MTSGLDTSGLSISGLDDLSLNTATIKRATLEQAVRICVDLGIPGIAPWRDVVTDAGLEHAAKLVRDAGLTVTSLCRGGFLTGPDAASRAAALDDNRRAVDEAATLGTGTLILVVGGIATGDNDLPGARRQVADGVAELVPYAAERGVRLAIEPLHPMFCADRAVVSTLEQALDIAAPHAPGHVGVVVDTYHVWWDPKLAEQVARAGAEGRLASFQVCDWLVPLPADMLLGRGHVGDGWIDVPGIAAMVRAAGHTGFTEVEIFNQDVWDEDPRRTAATVVERHLRHLRGGR